MTLDITYSIVRDLSAARLNAVANDVSVRQWVAPGTHALDFSALVANPINYALMNDGGGLLFVQHRPGRYEVHTQFIEAVRGKAALAATQDALRWMFTFTDAEVLISKAAGENHAARQLAHAIHGDLRFSRDGHDHFVLDLDRWVSKETRLGVSGEWFHTKLEAAKALVGSTLPNHDEDQAHDLYVGATVEMVLGGQVLKAMRFYNDWAAFAGYGPAKIIASDPLIDIGDAVLLPKPNDFDVILTR